MTAPTYNDQPSDIINIKAGGDSVSVHRFGATIISWKVDNKEKLFVRYNIILPHLFHLYHPAREHAGMEQNPYVVVFLLYFVHPK